MPDAKREQPTDLEIEQGVVAFATSPSGEDRTLNFTGIKWDALPALLDTLGKSFECDACQVSGNPQKDPDWTALLERIHLEDGTLVASHVVRPSLQEEEAHPPVSAFELFLSAGTSSPTYVELTFTDRAVFPVATGRHLLVWFRQLQLASGADAFFFRDDNAGWEEGDATAEAGVVATSIGWPPERFCD